MKKITLFVLSCTVVWSAHAQWISQNSNTLSSLYDIVFPGGGVTGYAAGSIGEMVKTTSAGSSWSVLTNPESDRIYGIWFTDASTGFAIANDGTDSYVLKTTDGGSSWNRTNTGESDNLLSVCFTSSVNGIISGANGLILRTTNGGTTWSKITSGVTENLYKVSFFDANTGFICGSIGTILKSTDGGASWTLLTTGTTNSFYGIDFATATTGCAVGYGYIYRTTNGGSSWTEVSGISTDDWFEAVAFADANTGYATGSNIGDGIIAKTTDGGATWTVQQPNSTAGTLYAVWPVNVNTVYVSGYSGVILKTTNGGGATGLNDGMAIHENELRVYPNPSQGTIYIRSEEAAGFTVYEMDGRKIKEGTLSGDLGEAQIMDMKAGLYLVVCHLKSGMVFQRVQVF